MHLERLIKKPSIHKLLKQGLDLENQLISHNFPKEITIQLSHYLLKLEKVLKSSTRDDDFVYPTKKNISSKTNFDSNKSNLAIALENIRSAYNVGSIFRNADCLGIKHIYLLGYTPGPDHPSVAKTALGACDSISWSHHSDINELKNNISYNSTMFLAAETTDKAAELQSFKFDPKQETIIFFGNEVYGLSEKTLTSISKHIKIPMLGTKNSLNVANAMAIFSFYYNLKQSN